MSDLNKVKLWTLSIFTFIMVFSPIFMYYIKFRLGAVTSFLVGDAFYYLDVARYSQGLSFFTFDGVHATNGFHPFWQYLLTYLAHFPMFSFSGRNQITHFFLLDLFFVSIGYGLLSTFVAKQVRLFWLVPIALCPGLTWFIASIIDSDHLSAWSYVNGMESGLSLLCFGLVLLLFDRKLPDGWKLYLGMFFLGLAVLARLDDAFFLLAFFAYSILRTSHNRIRAALPYATPFLMIAAYMIYNRTTVGIYLPISGASKASFALVTNLKLAVLVMLPRSWDLQSPATKHLNYSNWAELTIRLFQLWFPILLCCGYLVIGARRHKLQNRPILSCLCAGSLAKGLYNLIFVTIGAQGYWYYAVSIFICNVLLAVALDSLLQLHSLNYKEPIPSIFLNAGILLSIFLFTWFCFSGLIAHKRIEQYGSGMFQAFNHGPQIANDIRNARATSYLELEDGIISYVTGMPSTSGLGLAADIEAVKAKKEGRFLDLMACRDVHIIVASGYYIPAMNRILQLGLNPGEILGNVHSTEFARYYIQPGPRDEDSDIAIYRIVKKNPDVIADSNPCKH
jgi:hypothetical protein